MEELLTIPTPDGMNLLEYVPKFRLDEALDLLQRLEQDIAHSTLIRGTMRDDSTAIIGVHEVYAHYTPPMDLERIRRILLVNGRVADTKAG